jgi:hypothetical protein
MILIPGAGQLHAGTVLNHEFLHETGAPEHDWGTQVALDGFTATSTPDPGRSWSVPSTLGSLMPQYPGATALLNRQPTGGLILARAGGGLFSLLSIDLAELPAAAARRGSEANDAVRDAITHLGGH